MNTTSQSRENRIESLAQRIQTVAMNKQVLHTLPFAEIDDWALECFFDPIDNEDELSTPEQDRMRALRIAGFAKQAVETLDEMREIALALFQSRYGGEQGGQDEQTQHTAAGMGIESEIRESTGQRVDDAPVQLSMDPSASSSSPG